MERLVAVARYGSALVHAPAVSSGRTTLRASDDDDAYLLLAEAREQTPEACDACGGSEVSVRGDRRDPSSVESSCRECDGSGHEHGECGCGNHGVLVPDLARADDGTADGAMLVCVRCAVTCDLCCARVSIVADTDTREQLCEHCWPARAAEIAAFERRLS